MTLGGSISGLATTAALNSSYVTINGTNVTLGGSISGLATTTNNLTQFATTTSAELASIISGKTGTGSLVFAAVGSTPTSGQALVWDGTTWAPGNVSSSIGTYSINELSDVDTTTVEPTVGQSLVWNGAKWVPGTSSGKVARLLDTITTDDITSVFALTYQGALVTPANSASLIVTIGGVYQIPESAYTVTGTNITFAEALPTGAVVSIVEQGSGGGGGTDSGFYDGTATVVTPSIVVADSFAASQYSTAKYLVQATAGAEIHSTELTVIHNGTTAYSTEYGTIYTTELFSVSVSLVSGNVEVTVTTAVADTTIDFKRISIVSRLTTTGSFDLEGELMSGSGTVDLEIGTGTYDLMGTTPEDMASGSGTEDLSGGTGVLDLMA